MFTKFSVLALCAATSLNGASAAIPRHRHQHPQRDVVIAKTDVVVVTEYATVTVNQGEQPAAAAPTLAAADEKPAVEIPNPLAEPPAAPSPTTLAKIVKPETPASAAPVQAEDAQPTTDSSSSTSSQGSSGGKRGAAFNNADMVQALLGQTNAISWVYNWADNPLSEMFGVPFYPTMWGEKFAGNWPKNAQAACDKGAEVLFSFNEPDNAGQANMPPAYAAAKHQEWLNPYAGRGANGGPRISAPSISSSQEKNQGIDWLTQFFSACGGKCKVDFCNAHWYGPGGDAGAEEFLTHLRNVRDVDGCNGKIWVTEFMPQGSAPDNEAFMRHIVRALESPEYDFVEKYSYFMVDVGETYLMSSTSQLNTLGKIYANLA